nr:hypothetical protein [Anaerobacillus arseniciselenatis]
MLHPQPYSRHAGDQRVAPGFIGPGLGLGLGFLGGLATGALLTPGPGFGYAYRPPYYYQYPYHYPYPVYGYPQSPYFHY